MKKFLFLLTLFLAISIPITFILSLSNIIIYIVILDLILALIFRKNINLYTVKPFNNYSINNKELIIYSDTEKISVRYYDITNLWINNNDKTIDIDVNEELKTTGVYNPKSTNMYEIKCSKDNLQNDFNRLLMLSRLKIDMNKDEINLRYKRINELFKSGKIGEF